MAQATIDAGGWATATSGPAKVVVLDGPDEGTEVPRRANVSVVALQ